jgi:hypothetical protein
MIDLRERFPVWPIPNESAIELLLDLFTVFVPFTLSDHALQTPFALFPGLRSAVADRHQVRDTASVLVGGKAAEGSFRWSVSKLGVGRIELVVNVLSDGLGLLGRKALRGILGHCLVDHRGEFFHRKISNESLFTTVLDPLTYRPVALTTFGLVDLFSLLGLLWLGLKGQNRVVHYEG